MIALQQKQLIYLQDEAPVHLSLLVYFLLKFKHHVRPGITDRSLKANAFL